MKKVLNTPNLEPENVHWLFLNEGSLVIVLSSLSTGRWLTIGHVSQLFEEDRLLNPQHTTAKSISFCYVQSNHLGKKRDHRLFQN